MLLVPEVKKSVFDETCEFVEEFLDLFLYALCFRCAKEQGITQEKIFHHCGRIYFELFSENFTENQVSKWIEDLEHGLFHGLNTCIMAGLVIQDEFNHVRKLICQGGDLLKIKEKNLTNRKVSAKITDILDPKSYTDYNSSHCQDIISFEKLMASCLYHDFLKSNGHRQEDHDKDLKSVFPNLMESTYSHSYPSNYHDPLIVADVIELRRYGDWNKWYIPGNIESFLDKKQSQMIDCYYSCIRPCLEKAFHHRNSSWIRHGPEVPQDTKNHRYPQHPCEWFAVEIDRLPFTKCFNHDNHLPSAPWSVIKGAISYHDFKNKGGQAKPHMESFRDHLFAKVDTTLNDWIFVVDHEVVPNATWALEFTNNLIKTKQKIVKSKVLNKFVELSNSIIDRINFMSLNSIR